MRGKSFGQVAFLFFGNLPIFVIKITGEKQRNIIIVTMGAENIQIYHTEEYVRTVEKQACLYRDPSEPQSRYIIVEGSLEDSPEPVSVLYVSDINLATDIAQNLGIQRVWSYQELVQEGQARLAYFGETLSDEQLDDLKRNFFGFARSCEIPFMQEWEQRIGDTEAVIYPDGSGYMFGIGRNSKEVLQIVQDKYPS